MLVPLTELVSKCSETKATGKNWTKKRPWYWTEKHWEAVERIKCVDARDILLAYPVHSDVF